MSRKKREERIRAAKANSSAAAAVAAAPSTWGRVVAFVAGKKWLLAIVIVLLAAGVMFGVWRFVRHRLEVVPGRPTGEVIVGTTVILLDHVAIGGGKNGGQPTSQGERLTAIDVKTGEELAVDVPDHKTCWAGGTRLWCETRYGQVVLLDPRTLETIAKAEDLIAAAKLAKPIDRYDIVGDDVTVHLSDGRGATISSATLAVTKLETIGYSGHRFANDRCDTRDQIAHGAGRLILRSGSRKTLTSEPPPPAESATPSGPALTFLDGGFLTASGAPIVLSRDAVDGPDRLTRVDSISHAVWEYGVGGTCRLAQVVGDTLVVITGNPDLRAFALDLKTGARRWSFER